MKYTLALKEDRDIFRIVWISEEGDEGAVLGDDYATATTTRAALLVEKNKSVREHMAASLAAFESSGAERNVHGLFWRERDQAVHALKMAKIAVKNLEHPWPAWALEAKAHGWTPPKGWKP